MTIDIDKTKLVLAALEQEKQEMQERLELAAKAKQKIDKANAIISTFHCNCE